MLIFLSQIKKKSKKEVLIYTKEINSNNLFTKCRQPNKIIRLFHKYFSR